MHKTVKNTSIYLSQIFISGVILLISMPIITHQIPPDIFGQFVLTQVYAGIAVGIANFGLIVGYERNFFIYQHSVKQSAQLLYTTLGFVAAILTIILIPLWFWRDSIIMLITDKDNANLLIAIFIGSAFNTLAQYYLTYLKNKGLAKSFVFFMLLQAISNFLLIIGLLFLTDLGVLSLAYAWMISNTLLILSLGFNYYKQLPFSLDTSLLKPMLKISLPLTPKVFFGAINTQFDKIMLGLISSTGAVGVYQIGQTIALMIFQFMTGLDRVFKPEVYQKLFANKHQTHPDEINNYVLPFFYLSIFVALIFGLFAKEAIILLLPSHYSDASIVVMILSIFYGSLFFGKITGNQLIYAKKTFLFLYLTPINMAINIALNIPFIIYWGIIGAALATTIAGIISTLIGYILAQKYAKIHWQWQKIWRIYAIFLLGIIFTLLDYIYPLWINGIIALIIKLSIIAGFIVAGFRLNIVNLDMIRKIR